MEFDHIGSFYTNRADGETHLTRVYATTTSKPMATLGKAYLYILAKILTNLIPATTSGPAYSSYSRSSRLRV